MERSLLKLGEPRKKATISGENGRDGVGDMANDRENGKPENGRD